jgi:small multidrug resistance pump
MEAYSAFDTDLQEKGDDLEEIEALEPCSRTCATRTSIPTPREGGLGRGPRVIRDVGPSRGTSRIHGGVTAELFAVHHYLFSWQTDHKGNPKMFYLLLAIVAEVTGTTFVKLSQGFTRLVPSVLLFIFYGLSLGFLGLALKKVDLSIAYAVWSGLGIAFIASVGILYFREPVTLMKMGSLALIVAGVVGLNLVGEAR